MCVCVCFAELLPVLQEAQAELGEGLTVCVVDQLSPSAGLIPLVEQLEQVSDAAPQPPPTADLRSDFLIIFTSGTTGRAAAAEATAALATATPVLCSRCVQGRPCVPPEGRPQHDLLPDVRSHVPGRPLRHPPPLPHVRVSAGGRGLHPPG